LKKNTPSFDPRILLGKRATFSLYFPILMVEVIFLFFSFTGLGRPRGVGIAVLSGAKLWWDSVNP